MSKKILESLDALAGPEARAAIKALGEISGKSTENVTENANPGLVVEKPFSGSVSPSFAGISESLRPYSSKEANATTEALKESLAELVSLVKEAEKARLKADLERDLELKRQQKLTRRIVLVGIVVALVSPWLRPQPQPQPAPPKVDLVPIELRLQAIENSLKAIQTLPEQDDQ